MRGDRRAMRVEQEQEEAEEEMVWIVRVCI